jgi:hypothetical protein
MYELTDRLAYYLCSRKPDHQIGQHYIVPEMSDSLDQTEFARAAKKKLQLVSNHHVCHNSSFIMSNDYSFSLSFALTLLASLFSKLFIVAFQKHH